VSARLIGGKYLGLFGQLVDGALGMAFGVPTSTVLLSNGISPVASSASVHLAEIGTTFTSGLSHWRFGNVSWPLVARIGVPGAVGAFAGATVLSSFTGDWLTPAVASVLFGLGVLVIVRSRRGDLPADPPPQHAAQAVPGTAGAGRRLPGCRGRRLGTGGQADPAHRGAP
jgi:uncharacterized protein